MDTPDSAMLVRTAYKEEVKYLYHTLLENLISKVPDAATRFANGLDMAAQARDVALSVLEQRKEQ